MNKSVLLSSCGIAACPKLAYAHGGGLFTLFVGVPLAIVLFIVSAAIVRVKYRHMKTGAYWAAVLSLLVPWLFLYLVGVIGLSDAGIVKNLISGYYTREYFLTIFISCIPLAFAIGMRILARRSTEKNICLHN